MHEAAAAAAATTAVAAAQAAAAAELPFGEQAGDRTSKMQLQGAPYRLRSYVNIE